MAVWLTGGLSDAIIAEEEINITSIVTDLLCGKIDITLIIENMSGVLINKEAQIRKKGLQFLTSILKTLPKSYLTDQQVGFISKFYIERLKDNHIMIPTILDGYLSIIDMNNYKVELSADFFTLLFREVTCQSQVREDRYNIYLIIKKIMEKHIEYVKTLGPDFVYGVISSIDGERDPRNLIFLFELLPNFISNVPLGHLVEEIFEVISCYYPIDFQPVPNNPAQVSRQDLADSLAPCLCAIPEFSEPCLLLLIEKLDSSLRIAKIDSLKLLAESCKTFNPESYAPFLKTLWSSIHRELIQKTDTELTISAQEALVALVKKIASTAGTDQAFENFIKGILISMQRAITEASTVAQFSVATKVLLLTADASKDACLLITKSMIPAMVAYYGLTASHKLQIATLTFLGHLCEGSRKYIDPSTLDVLKEIPSLCLTAVSEPVKEYQLAGFQTLIKTKDAMDSELIVPFVDILIHNVQCSQDNDLLSVSVMAVNAIARKYPEEIMGLIVVNKCNFEKLTQDKSVLQKRLNLLCNLASIGEFTKVIIEEMLRIISSSKDDAAGKVVMAMDESLSNGSLYVGEKVAEMESDHALIDSILRWLLREIPAVISQDSLSHGYSLIATTMSSLPAEKQQIILNKHTKEILELCSNQEMYFFMLEALYSSIHQTVYNDDLNHILLLALNSSLNSENEALRTKANMVVAHFLNKAEYVEKFEILYESLKSYLMSCQTDDVQCPRLLELYGWITKALLMRGSELYMFWLQKIMKALSTPEHCRTGAHAIRLIAADHPDCLTLRQHARISLLYKQKLFQTFAALSRDAELTAETREAHLLAWAFILGKVPKSVLSSEIEKIAPLVIDSLEYDKRDLLLVMVDILTYLVQVDRPVIADSLQTILPRLLKLSTYVKSMDVRIKSLQCIYDIANNYATVKLLPYKTQILADLAPSLDDKKRLVRNMAVKARTRWYLIGAPGDVKDN